MLQPLYISLAKQLPRILFISSMWVPICQVTKIHEVVDYSHHPAKDTTLFTRLLHHFTSMQLSYALDLCDMQIKRSSNVTMAIFRKNVCTCTVLLRCHSNMTSSDLLTDEIQAFAYYIGPCKSKSKASSFSDSCYSFVGSTVISSKVWSRSPISARKCMNQVKLVLIRKNSHRSLPYI